jgi:hypothetical protein
VAGKPLHRLPGCLGDGPLPHSQAHLQDVCLGTFGVVGLLDDPLGVDAALAQPWCQVARGVKVAGADCSVVVMSRLQGCCVQL